MSITDQSFQLIKDVKLLGEGLLKKVENQEIEGYIKTEDGRYYIAFLYDKEEKILDKFVGFQMETGPLRLKSGDYKQALYLSSSDDIQIQQFAYIAVDFLKKENRQKIIENPYAWSDSWREIFGDTITKDYNAAILGEMIALKFVYEQDKTAQWLGAFSSSQDIVCEKKDVEVKTTFEKKVTRITINSGIQLGGEKPQKLYFVRLERKPNALSIDSVKKELVDLGFSESKIEEALEKKGLPKGIRKRTETYDLIEVRSYNVDDDSFPLFSLADLNERVKSKNIIDYSLSIDLAKCPFQIVYSKK